MNIGKKGKAQTKGEILYQADGGGEGVLKQGDLPCQVLTEMLTIFLCTDIKIFKMCLF